MLLIYTIRVANLYNNYCQFIKINLANLYNHHCQFIKIDVENLYNQCYQFIQSVLPIHTQLPNLGHYIKPEREYAAHLLLGYLMPETERLKSR